MPGRVTLNVVNGPIQGQKFEFEEHDTFIFGRSPDCHARLSPDDTTASRHHFLLEVNPPDARIRDLGSRNGTYVNDVKRGGRAAHETAEEASTRRFTEVDLKDADRIRVGETVFEVRVEVPRAAKAEPIRCQQCDRDVSGEVGGGRRGDYVCQACQATAVEEPATVLLRMIGEQTRQRGGSGPGEIPGFDLGRILGRGGMGAVYLARRRHDGAQVAIKIMLSKVAVDERSREVFRREIEVTRSLKHPRCVELLDHGSAGCGFYFAMELCPGGSMDGLLERHGGRVPAKLAGSLMLEALEGLAYAHQKSFVHRDLKPQNILVMDRDGRGAKVSDFGLAKNFQKAGFSGMTATRSTAGTFPFMAREQLTNFKFVKPASDVWSMGATLYLLLTGQLPRDFGQGEDPMQVILRGGIVPIRRRDAGVPRALAEVIDRSLADEVADRYRDAGEFRKALAEVL